MVLNLILILNLSNPTLPHFVLQVWEIRGAELSLSPVHRAAAGRIPGSERGLALRFPRFISIRSDKSPEDATGPDMLTQMYMAQQRRVVP